MTEAEWSCRGPDRESVIKAYQDAEANYWATTDGPQTTEADRIDATEARQQAEAGRGCPRFLHLPPWPFPAAELPEGDQPVIELIGAQSGISPSRDREGTIRRMTRIIKAATARRRPDRQQPDTARTPSGRGRQPGASRKQQGDMSDRHPREPGAPAPGELALAEYKQLKAEQVARISTRDNLIYVTIVSIAGVLTVTQSAHSRGYLLLVPAVTGLLGWTYLVNDNMISSIGRYVREHPALSAMGWEAGHTADRRRASRKAIQLATDLATFCGSAAAALIAFWLALGSPLLLAASAVEAIATGLLATQFVLYADLPVARSFTTRHPGRNPPP